MRHANVRYGRLGSRVLGAALAALTVAGVGACSLDELLDVELPGQVEVSEAELPSKAPTLVNGGITMFNCALTWHIFKGALLGDELDGGPLFGTDGDDRSTFAGYVGGVTEQPNCASHYAAVAEARWMNDHVLGLLETWSDAEVANRSLQIARAAAYAGYSLVLLGEGFCSGAIDAGPELQSAQVLQQAEDRFTRAIAAATAAGSAEFRHLALVGRARSRLFRGQLAEARADAVLVPAGYVKRAQYPATATRVNENGIVGPSPGIYVGNGQFTIGTLYRGAQWAGVPDPRISTVNTGLVATSGLPLWVTTKYASRQSPIRVASWVEAQLIVAEADLAANDVSTAVGVINQLHEAAGLPDFTSADPLEVRDQLIYERRAEFFFEGQHIGDYRRYPLPFVPAPGTSYYGLAGSTFGDGRCYPFPNSERVNNPNTN